MIVGAGTLGELLYDCADGDESWNVIAFLDEGKAGGRLFDRPILHPERYDPRQCRDALVAIGFPAVRKALVERLAPLRLSWMTYVDRRSRVSGAAVIGAGTIVLPFATVAPRTSLGRFAYVGGYASVGKNAVLGDFVSLMPRASVSACAIGDGCSIGLNSACLDGACLGEGVTVAPYTWVRKAVPGGSFVAGMPSRVMRPGRPPLRSGSGSAPSGRPACARTAATVVIPLRNNARYIGALLESLFLQWRPEFELLLIDDQSADDGFERVHTILAGHPGIRATVMRNETAQGTGMVERILRLCRTEIVIRADSDDLALPGRLDATMACFESDPDCRLVSSNALLISPEARAIGIYDTRSRSAVTRDPRGPAASVGDTRWLGATIAYHRDIYDQFPPLDAELWPYGLDLLLPFRSVLLGSHHYLAEPLVGWRQHSTNTHRMAGHYDASPLAQERYRALHMMVLAQKVRDVAFLAGRAPTPLLDEALSLSRDRFDAEFAGWCRLRTRAMASASREIEPVRAEYRPGIPPLPTLAVGETLRFSKGDFGAELLSHYAGFHASEDWGTWTQGVAHLSLRIVTVPASPVRLALRLAAPGLTPSQRVRMRVGTDVWTEVEVAAAEPRDVVVRCPAVREARVIDLVLVMPDAIVPAEVDPNWPDARLLGVGLISISASRGLPPPRGEGGHAGEAAERDAAEASEGTDA